MVEGEYINQRFASIERKLDTIDTKLDEMRKDRIMCQKECAADVEKIKTEVRALELKHEAALAKQATELGICFSGERGSGPSTQRAGSGAWIFSQVRGL